MKQLEMYEFDHFVHCRCRLSTIVEVSFSSIIVDRIY